MFRKNIAVDDYFNFCEGLSSSLIHELEAFVEKQRDRLGKGEYLLNRLVLKAAEGYNVLNFEKNREEFEGLVSGYFDLCDDLLSYVQSLEPNVHRPSNFETSLREHDFRSHARRVFGDFLVEVSPVPFPWFITGGTLLGAVREGDFLKHDFDIDVGIFADEELIGYISQLFRNSKYFSQIKFEEQVQITFDGENYRVSHYPSLIKLVHNTGINLDIFIHYEDRGNFIHGSGNQVWHNKKFGLTRIEFLSFHVFAPFPSDYYLAEHYGDWQKEKRVFSCVADTYNISFSKNLMTPVNLLRRAVSAALDSPKERDSILRKIEESSMLSTSSDGYFMNRSIFRYDD